MKRLKKYILAICIVLLFTGIIKYCLSYNVGINLVKAKMYNTVAVISTLNIPLSKEKSKWYSLRAYSKFEKKDYKGAIKDFDFAYKNSNDEYSVMHFDNKITVKYIIKDYKSAIEDFDREIASAKTEEIRDSFLWDKAQFLYNIALYDKSLEIYDELISRSDEDDVYLIKNRLYYERAQVYDKLHLTLLAIKDRFIADALDIEEDYKKPIPRPVLLIDDLQSF